MNVFLDTNVVLDVLMKRTPVFDASARVWSFIERGGAAGYLSAYTFNNVFYVMRKERPAKRRVALARLRATFRVAAVDEEVIFAAIASYGVDFEDQVQALSAERAGAEVILTRDKAFPQTSVQALTPEQFIGLYGA